ncbi:MAG: hypothetical protein HQ595_02880, partial [Candidatus Omnitrophica bacterium]|nr:hypothetical protein [Candidatus Omnitrophota bacterium]
MNDEVEAPTPGAQAAVGRPLEDNEISAFDSILKKLFTKSRLAKGKTKVIPFDKARKGFAFVRHEGLIDRLENAGLPFNVHPGRGGRKFKHGLLEAHMDAFIYDNLTDEERLTIALHELAHLDIANGFKGQDNPTYRAYISAINKALKRNPALDQKAFQERFVNSLSGCNVTAIDKKFQRLLSIRKKAKAALAGADQRKITPEVREIAQSVEFGDAVRTEIKRLIKKRDYKGLKDFARKVAAMRQNAAKMRTAFTDYKGYDVIIISSPEESITREKQELFDKIFGNIEIGNKYTGNKVMVLCVTDDIGAGQNTGQGVVLEQAKKLAEERGLKGDLGDLVNDGKIKVGVYQDGGAATRKSTIIQSLFMSRAATPMGGDIKINQAGDKVPLTLDTFVMARTSNFAETLIPGTIDIFWINQIGCSTVLNTELIREEGHSFSKIVVKINIPETAKKSPQSFFYYGLAVFGKATGRAKRWINRFFGNKRFAKPEEGGYVINEEKFSDIQDEIEAGLDYGSLNTSWNFMWMLYELYTKIGVIEEAKALKAAGKSVPYKRDLDPHILQPLQMILPEVAEKGLPEGLPSGEELRSIENRDALIAELVAAETIFRAHLSDECKAALATTRDEDLVGTKIKYGPVSEAIWFYLMSRDTDIFELNEQFLGYIDIGEDTNWRPYKSAVDDVHGQFAMLADLTGESLELDTKKGKKGGKFKGREATAWEKIEAENMRYMRGWTSDNVCRFRVDGIEHVLTYEQVKKGVTIDEVYIKNAIVQNCDLRKGSKIENSVVTDSEGLIKANYSLIENSIALDINAKHSYILNLASDRAEKANSQLLVDCYGESLKGKDDRFTGQRDGQTRLRTDIRFDPGGKMFPGQSDETIQFDNRLTPQEVRNARLDAEKDKELMGHIRDAVRKKI